MTETQQADKFKIIAGQIEKACLEEAQVIALGDWNVDIHKLDTFYLPKVADVYKECIAKCGLKPIDFGITFRRVHKDGKVIESAVDHVLIKKPEMVNDYSKGDITYSDHSSIIIDLSIGVTRNKQGLTKRSRDLRKIRANPQYFQFALYNCPWDKLAQMEDVDEMETFFTSQIEGVLDKTAPYSNRKIKSKNSLSSKS